MVANLVSYRNELYAASPEIIETNVLFKSGRKETN